jgi:excalibur calcium-binding domain-containing protein
VRGAAPTFLAAVCAAALAGCGSPTSTPVTPLADSSLSSSAAATTSTTTTTTTSTTPTPTSTAPAVAAGVGAGVGYGSGVDEAVAGRAVRAVVPTTTRRAPATQRAAAAPKPVPKPVPKPAPKPVPKPVPKPAPKPVPKPAPAPKTTTKKAEPKKAAEPKAASGASYGNCSQAKAAGAAPLYAGQPGYAKKLDRDGDGVACET